MFKPEEKDICAFLAIIMLPFVLLTVSVVILVELIFEVFERLKDEL